MGSRGLRVGLIAACVFVPAAMVAGCDGKAAKKRADEKVRQMQAKAADVIAGDLSKEAAELCKSYMTMFDVFWKSGGFIFATDVTLADFDTRSKTIRSLMTKREAILTFLENLPKTYGERLAADGYPADRVDVAVSGFRAGLHLDMQRQIRDLDVKLMKAALARFDLLRTHAGHWRRQGSMFVFGPEIPPREAEKYGELTTELRDAWNDKSALQQKLIDAGTTIGVMPPTGPIG